MSMVSRHKSDDLLEIEKFLLNTQGYKILNKNDIFIGETGLYYECPNGVRHNTDNYNFKLDKECSICNKKGYSNSEVEIYEYVKKIYSGKVIHNDRSTIRVLDGSIYNNYIYFEIDVWMPGIRKAIEYNGDYYHSSDRSKKNDALKKKYCDNNGIQLLVIEEKEWLKNKDFEKIKKFINNRTVLRKKF